MQSFPTINMVKTGENINALRITNGYSVKDIQTALGFSSPQAIYHWQWGKSIPSIDNLIALSIMFHTPLDSILVLDSQGAILFIHPKKPSLRTRLFSYHFLSYLNHTSAYSRRFSNCFCAYSQTGSIFTPAIRA